MAMLATRLKDAVDLDSVRDDLASVVVQQALEPARMSVWITPRDGLARPLDHVAG